MAEPVLSPASPEGFVFPLLNLARHWRWWLDRRLKPARVTQGIWFILAYLKLGGDGMVQKDLAKFIGIEGPPSSGISTASRAWAWWNVGRATTTAGHAPFT